VSAGPISSTWLCHQFSPALLEAVVQADFTVEAGPFQESKIILYDSFDRCFLRQGLAMIRSFGHFKIVDADDLCSQPIESGVVIRHQRPVFAWDFEPGNFQLIASRRLGVRAAMQLAITSLEQLEFRIRNVDGKVVLRFRVERVRAEGDVEFCRIQAEPLLGYDEEAGTLTALVDQSDAFEACAQSLAACVLDALGLGGYPLAPKDVVQLHAKQTVQEAVTQIADGMVQVARQNEPGIIEDVDTEYLHDYRVAIRKLRSVVSLVKGAYPKADTLRIKDAFGDYARATNRLRDLDVYLLNESVYRSLLPEGLRPGLDRMFSDFRSSRTRACTKVRKWLQSEDYLKGIDAEADWLRQAELPEGIRSVQEIRPVAVLEITKHYKLVRRLGMGITDATPDEEVHELRIECKKLRYLLELFGSLFDAAQLKRILKRLRGLQNVLGDFNDYSVQVDSLTSYLNGAKQMDKISAAAVGGLIAVLQQKQLSARAHVQDRFHEFSDGKMRSRFKQLFKVEKGGGQ